MIFGERLVNQFDHTVQRGIEKYPDEIFVSLIMLRAKSILYNRSFKKYFPIVEANSLVSGYTIPNLLARIDFRQPYGIGLFRSAAPAYTLGRMIDDMADGDIDPKEFNYESFPAYIDHTKREIENQFAHTKKWFTLDFLMKYTINRLIRDQKEDDDVVGDWNLFLEAMLVEYDRRVNRKILTREELNTTYDASFGPAHNIMLIAYHSKTRFKDIKETSRLQGGVFAFCDLKLELKRSICNIPMEVLNEAGLDPFLLMENPDLLDGNDVIQNWMKAELEAARINYQKLKQKIPKLDFTARLYLKFLMKGVESGIKRVEKDLY